MIDLVFRARIRQTEACGKYPECVPEGSLWGNGISTAGETCDWEDLDPGGLPAMFGAVSDAQVLRGPAGAALAHRVLSIATMFDPQTSVAAIVLDHSECAVVFDRFRIDYCCQGKRTLAESCEAKKLPLEQVAHQLELAVSRRVPVAIDPRTLSTHDLITRVISRHHQYLHRTLPFLRGLSAKVARVHGDREPDLIAISILVDKLAEILIGHLHDEEYDLFPDLLADPVPPRVGAALARMEEEHDEVGTRLEELRDVVLLPRFSERVAAARC